MSAPLQPGQPQPSSGPNCWGCLFFGVSHNPATPYACRRMGFQSRTMPAIEVLRVCGQPCQGFSLKTSGCQSFGTQHI